MSKREKFELTQRRTCIEQYTMNNKEHQVEKILKQNMRLWEYLKSNRREETDKFTTTETVTFSFFRVQRHSLLDLALSQVEFGTFLA